MVEGIYWALATYTGGLFTDDLADFSRHEWEMTVPDRVNVTAIAEQAEKSKNATSFEEGSPVLYSIYQEAGRRSATKWLPPVMANGRYLGDLPGRPRGPSGQMARSRVPWVKIVLIIVALLLVLVAGIAIAVALGFCGSSSKRHVGEEEWSSRESGPATSAEASDETSDSPT